MVQLPYGMMALTPATDPAVRDKYLAQRILGFPAAGFLLMAATGELETDPAKFASLFDHDLETATPYYHAVTLQSYGIQAEYTVARRAAHYRFTFPAGEKIGFAAGYAARGGDRLEVRVGISYISAEWNRALAKIAVSGGSEDQRTIFYTALYRGMLRIIDYSEEDRYFSIADGKVHSAGGRGFYAGGRLWGSYRSLHPLQLLIAPAREQDFIQSYVRLYEQGGWLPSIATLGPDRPTMYRPSMQVGPHGYCGDEDGGDMSSWYVFSAMGFFPVSPGRPVYDLGSPIFPRVRISLENGKVFTITAPNVSARNKYIRSAVLNGKPLSGSWIEHADIAAGGSLVLEMSAR